MQHTTRKLGASLLASALLWAPVTAPQLWGGQSAQAAEMMRKEKNVPVELEPWPGRRVVLLLPLQLGVGFNADQQFGKLILPRAEAELTAALEATGKFSVLRVHRFSPLVQRGLQEKRITPADVSNITAEPISIENATEFLSKYTFDQTPLIADFRLEEVRSSIPGMAGMKMKDGQMSGKMMSNGMSDGQTMKNRDMVVDAMMDNGMMGQPLQNNATSSQSMSNKSMMGEKKMQGKMKAGVPGVQAQISGKLYQLDGAGTKNSVVTSMSIQKGRNNIERYLLAASDAFERIATQFTAPLEDVTLPTAGQVRATPVENATTPIASDTSTAVTTPDPGATDNTSPIPTPPGSEDGGPIIAPTPDDPMQGNPVPADKPAGAN